MNNTKYSWIAVITAVITIFLLSTKNKWKKNNQNEINSFEIQSKSTKQGAPDYPTELMGIVSGQLIR